MSFPYKPIPGASQSEVVAFVPGDARDPGHTGRTLTALRARYGGDEFDVVNPLTGEETHISLHDLAKDDSPDTRYVVVHRFVPDKPIADEHLALIRQHEMDSRVTLHDEPE